MVIALKGMQKDQDISQNSTERPNIGPFKPIICSQKLYLRRIKGFRLGSRFIQEGDEHQTHKLLAYLK